MSENIYVILQRNGWKFGAICVDYVIVNPKGEIVMRDMHKLNVEKKFMELSK